MKFKNRNDAAQRLSLAISDWKHRQPVILGIPRGGIPLAATIATDWDCDLDLLLVRKFVSPLNPEYALGAVTEAGDIYPGAGAQRLGLSSSEVERLARPEIERLREKRRLYGRCGRSINLEGRNVIIVDDGIATGWTARAAVRSVQRRGAQNVVVATPVISPGAADRLLEEGASVRTVLAPTDFRSVSDFYLEFNPVDDVEVVNALRRPRQRSTDLPLPLPASPRPLWSWF